MYKKHYFTAIILLAGKGERFNSTIPKQFQRLSGKKVFLHTLESFIAAKLFDEIILVVPQEYKEHIQSDLIPYQSHNIHIINGGNTRQESSNLGLLACNHSTEYVVIHDGVRPFISNKIIMDNVDSVLKYKAVDTCIPSADTIVHTDESAFIQEIPDRKFYLRGQTPQSFEYSLIVNAHKNAQYSNFTDDCRLVREMGLPVHVVYGDDSNIKITTELDLFIAEQLFMLKHKTIVPSATSGDLKHKNYIITGGNGGIGQEICRLLKEKNASPWPLSRKSKPYSVDLTNLDNIKETLSARKRLDGFFS